MSKEIAVRDTFDVTQYQGPTGLDDFGAEDVSMPWLVIAAKNTDAANEDSPDHIEGLKPGMFYIRSLSRVFGKTLNVIVLKYFKSYAEHTPGKDSKFIRVVTADEAKGLVRVGAIFPLSNGNVVKEAFNYLVVLPDAPDVGILRLSLGAGSFKHVKNWNSLMVASKVPMWAGIWELTTALATSTGGDTYYTLGGETSNIKRIGYVAKTMEADVIAAFNQAQGFSATEAPLPEEAPF